MEEAWGKVLGHGSHQGDGSSMGWRKTAIGGDVPGWWQRAVAGGDPGALLRLLEDKEMVRHGGTKRKMANGGAHR
jgi:hypothetical protein